MQRIALVLASIVALVLVPVTLFAKGNTVRIMISGRSLGAPIEITDPNVVRRFNIWAGPGTTSHGAEGLNVDWSRGVAHPPQGLESYNVSFASEHSQPSTYLVGYALDPATGEGYVYIPGKPDTGYRENIQMIYRGTEGHWFHA